MSPRRKQVPASGRSGPLPSDEHEIVYYKDEVGRVPGRDYLKTVPTSIAARLRAVAIAVATAPPYRFAGGGLWEAMHGSMTGWFEIRVSGPGRTHYRWFCLLDYEAKDATRPLLVIVDGRTKAFRTTLPDTEYAAVRTLGEHHRATQPRPID